MKTEKLAYQSFYITSFAFVVISIFAQHLSVFFKPPVILTLCFIYLIKSRDKRVLVLLATLVVLIAEVLTMKDFIGYFRLLNVLLSVYYLLNIILLWGSLKKIKIKLNKVFTVQTPDHNGVDYLCAIFGSRVNIAKCARRSSVSIYSYFIFRLLCWDLLLYLFK